MKRYRRNSKKYYRMSRLTNFPILGMTSWRWSIIQLSIAKSSVWSRGVGSGKMYRSSLCKQCNKQSLQTFKEFKIPSYGKFSTMKSKISLIKMEVLLKSSLFFTVLDKLLLLQFTLVRRVSIWTTQMQECGAKQTILHSRVHIQMGTHTFSQQVKGKCSWHK